MDKKEKSKLTPALLEECVKAHEESSKSGELLAVMNRPVRSTPQGVLQTQQKNSEN